MNLRVFDAGDALIRGTADAILRRIEEGARTIALSGGSTPKPLYRLLGEQRQLRDLPLTWIVVDERYVPITDPQSNAGMIESTLFADGIAPAHRFLRFPTELGYAAETARAFEREWQEIGLYNLDLVLLGVGDDGHTASLFPRTPVLDVEDRIASEVYVPRLNSWRVTLTKPVIRGAAMRFVLVAGASKKPVIEKVREGGSGYPIEAATAGVDTWWFVDRDVIETGSK